MRNHTTTTGPLHTMLSGAVFARIAGVAWLAVTGEDAVRWLNGMATANVQGLAIGHGAYTFFLNAQGRIQGDAVVWRTAEGAMLQTSSERLDGLIAFLDRFIIMDDVELTRVPSQGLLVIGAGAAAAVATAGLDAPENALQSVRAAGNGVLGGFAPMVPRYEIWSDEVASIADRLGIPEVGPEILEKIRILEGVPVVGVDIREKDLPQETAPRGTESRALHFSKGCYLGQEIVERIHSRGQVHRVFSGFRLDSLATAGTVLMAEEKTVGELTSVAEIDGEILALGYVRREALERNLTLSYEGGSATPARLPFPIG